MRTHEDNFYKNKNSKLTWSLGFQTVGLMRTHEDTFGHMRTPTKWTPKWSGTLPLGHTWVPEKLLHKQKFKINLVSWVSNAWLIDKIKIHEDTCGHLLN